MNDLFAIDLVGIDSTTCSRISLVLLHSLWQVTLLALLAWIVERRLSKKSVERSYTISFGMLLLGLLAMPVTYWATAEPQAAAAPTVVAASAPITAAQQPLLDAPPRIDPPAMDQAPVAAPTPAAPVEMAAAATAPPAPRVWPRVAPWLVGVYVVGVLVMLFRLIAGMMSAELVRLRSERLTTGPLPDLLRSLVKQWSMRVTPALAAAEDVLVPRVVGVLKPTILLPTSALTGLSASELELILAHELAHVRRYDMWVQLVQRLAESLLFFNPALWWLSRRVSALREYCCDEIACKSTSAQPEERVRYAEALLRVVELAASNHQQAPELAALAATGRSPSELRRRVARLFGEPLREPLRLSRGGVLGLAIACALLYASPFARSQPGTSSEEPAEIMALPPTTEGDHAVAAARARTFGLHKTPKVAFTHIYRQVQVPGMQSHPDDDMASLWLARASQVADAELDRNRHETRLAWDDGKLFLQAHTRFRPGESWLQAHYWDGLEGWIGEISQTKKGETKNVYRYADIERLTGHIIPFYYPHWAAVGDRLPWPGPTVVLDEHGVDSELTRYRRTGEETIDGVVCEVYVGAERHETLWIERATGLIKAMSRHYVSGFSDEENLRALNKAAGRDFKEPNQYQAWYDKQSDEEKEELSARWCAVTWEETTPGNLTVFSEYREIASGVLWPHQVDRVVVHSNHRGDDTFKYSLARVAVMTQSEFDIGKLAAAALPDPGVDVTDRRAGRNEFKYKWSSELNEADIVKLRDGKLAEVRAENEEVERINAMPINSVGAAIQVLTEGPNTDPTKVWARAIKYLTDHPQESLPELIKRLDKEQRDHPISKLAFALRAIGDRRATPALIRALPKTLLPSRSDYGLQLEDDELLRFMQKHDQGSSGGELFTYGRAFREVVATLRVLTKQNLGEMELNWVHLGDTPRQRNQQRQQFQRLATLWAKWWEANWESMLSDAGYAKANLPDLKLEPATPFKAGQLPSGPTVELVGQQGQMILKSVHESKTRCFLDLDTGREAGWPDSLPQLGEIV